MTAAYGRIVSLADAVEICVPLSNRRREVRRKPGQVPWLRSARLKYGPDVDIIDISSNGILIRHKRELAMNAQVVFEFAGTAGTVLVLARVVRSRHIPSQDFGESYEVACRFKRPLVFHGLVAEMRGRGTPTAKIAYVEKARSSGAPKSLAR
jgi:hypothetical protein